MTKTLSLSLCEYQRESVLAKSWGDDLLDWGWGWGGGLGWMILGEGGEEGR